MFSPQVFVVSSDAVLIKQVRSTLMQRGYGIAGDATSGAQALRSIRTLRPDLVVLDADIAGTEGTDIGAIIAEDRLAPILLIAPAWCEGLVNHGGRENEDRWVFAILTKPINEEALVPAVETALLNYERTNRLEQEVAKLKDTLEARKAIERAKGILMSSMNLSEDEAFRLIRQRSMDKSMPMRQIAEAIILAHEVESRAQKK